jgi:hypothetical protein
MPRGKRSFQRAGRAAVVAAMIVVGLSACSLGTSDAGGTAPLGGDTAGPSTGNVRAVSPASGSVKGGTSVTVSGTGLSAVRTALVGGAVVPAAAHAGSVTFTTPSASAFVPATDAVVLRTGSGATVGRTTYHYRMADGVDRELAYVLKYWKHYNPAYEALADNDCVDFTSQALLQRGWKQQGDWMHADAVLDSGAAWRSSTAFRDFMAENPELGTALTDQQRSKVKLGDVVQFDWDRSGDRDHTGVVTRITRSKSGHIEIDFAGHTNDSDYRSVDTAITKDHPGGVAYYWSLK